MIRAYKPGCGLRYRIYDQLGSCFNLIFSLTSYNCIYHALLTNTTCIKRMVHMAPRSYISAMDLPYYIYMTYIYELEHVYNNIEILLWTIEHANSHSKTSIQCFARLGLRQAYKLHCMPDEARDGRNIALKFSSDCWRAWLSKPQFLYYYIHAPGIQIALYAWRSPWRVKRCIEVFEWLLACSIVQSRISTSELQHA